MSSEFAHIIFTFMFICKCRDVLIYREERDFILCIYKYNNIIHDINWSVYNNTHSYINLLKTADDWKRGCSVLFVDIKNRKMISFYIPLKTL